MSTLLRKGQRHRHDISIIGRCEPGWRSGPQQGQGFVGRRCDRCLVLLLEPLCSFFHSSLSIYCPKAAGMNMPLCHSHLMFFVLCSAPKSKAPRAEQDLLNKALHHQRPTLDRIYPRDTREKRPRQIPIETLKRKNYPLCTARPNANAMPFTPSPRLDPPLLEPPGNNLPCLRRLGIIIPHLRQQRVPLLLYRAALVVPLPRHRLPPSLPLREPLE